VGGADKDLDGKTLPVAIVLDIEGTVTPISFVTKSLFPYARRNIGGLIKAFFTSGVPQTLQHAVQELCNEVCHVLWTYQTICWWSKTTTGLT
jgi:methionine salvage enolase-phosphatase E1